MAMGDEFEPNDIHAYQLADFAETCGINKKLLTRALNSLADSVIHTLTNRDLLSSISNDANLSIEDIKYCNLVSENILARTHYLRSQSADISTINV